MAWIVIPHKAKDDPLGVQSYNVISDDLNYLKTQSEVLVAAAGTAIKADVVPEAALTVSNSAVEGARLVSRAGVGGGLTWEEAYKDPFYWLGR
jgi:hypothetical protein